MDRREFLRYLAAAGVAAKGSNLTLTAPSSITIKQGQQVSATLQFQRKGGGKPEAASFSVSSLPPGVTAAFKPPSCASSCQTTVTLTAANNAQVGDYSIIFKAQTSKDLAMANTNITVGTTIFDDPPPPGTNQLGLHFTSDELAIWQDRAVNGPYKSAGDESTNSPGDWDRIVSHRNTFAGNPSNGRWAVPNTVGSCVPADSTTYGWPEGNTGEGGTAGDYSTMLRDAAFYDLVMGVTTDHAALKTELLWVSSQTWTQWGNPSGIWCFQRIWDSAPAVGIAAAMTRLLLAYDFMGRDAFSSGELDQLDRWFFDAADYWMRDLEVSINDAFEDRYGGDYTIINHPTP